MNYNEALNFIHSTPKFSRTLGNDLLRKLLSHLKNPHSGLRVIHIAGTNGKGSIAAMTAKILQTAGYKTGLFTSPFIETFNERIQINGRLISNEDLAELTGHVKAVMEEQDAFVSEFALTTAIAFLYFKRECCDVVVLETGLGGRLDATNVSDNKLACVITSISLDHTMYLGDTLEKIALEKCGIINDTSTVILYPLQEECVFSTVKKYVETKNARLLIPDTPKAIPDGFLYKGERYSLSVRGGYQIYNAATAIETVRCLNDKGFYISNRDIKSGLMNTHWAARFEFITPELILDGSHNPGGMKELCSSLNAIGTDIVLVIAMMSDKDCAECIRILSGIRFHSVVITELDMPRCCPTSVLKDEFEKQGIPATVIKNPIAAVGFAINTGKTVCISGSLYLAGAIRSHLNSLNIQ